MPELKDYSGRVDTDAVPTSPGVRIPGIPLLIYPGLLQLHNDGHDPNRTRG